MSALMIADTRNGPWWLRWLPRRPASWLPSPAFWPFVERGAAPSSCPSANGARGPAMSRAPANSA
jgi:hypothetical protein